MKPIILAAALLLPVSMTGCVIVDGDKFDRHSSDWDWKDKEQKNRRLIAELEPDMTVESVRRHMGTPDFNEFYDKEGQKVRVLFYRTQRQEGDGVTRKDECTPLVFRDGHLVGWGETAYSHM